MLNQQGKLSHGNLLHLSTYRVTYGDQSPFSNHFHDQENGALSPNGLFTYTKYQGEFWGTNGLLGCVRADLDRSFLRDQAQRYFTQATPFLKDYYRAAQDIGLLTVAVKQWRPSLVSQPNLHKSGFQSSILARSGLDALKRDLHFITQLALTKWFQSSVLALFGLDALKRDLHFITQLALTRVLLQRLTSSRQGRPGKEFRKLN